MRRNAAGWIYVLPYRYLTHYISEAARCGNRNNTTSLRPFGGKNPPSADFALMFLNCSEWGNAIMLLPL